MRFSQLLAASWLATRSLLVAAAMVVPLGSPSLAQQNLAPFDLPTTGLPVKITTGNTYQLILAATTFTVDQARKSLTIQNNNATDSCNLIVGNQNGQIVAGTTTTSTNITVPVAGAATMVTVTVAQASILLFAGGSYQRYFPYVPSDAIYGTCATTGDSIYLDIQQ